MIDISKINFDKSNGLVPAIIQDEVTSKVLMLGYMNEAAFKKTIDHGKVTFYSRSRDRLWTKGEESGNHLILKDIKIDCDADTLLIKASPLGPVCHMGTDTCWKEQNISESISFLLKLEKIIDNRRSNPSPSSYTSKLFEGGVNKIAQKVGEEAVELVIEAIDNNKELLKEETADLIYRLIILLRSKDISLDDISDILRKRHLNN